MRRSRTVTVGSVAALSLAYLTACSKDEPKKVDAQPVCVIERGDQLEVVDLRECQEKDTDGLYRARQNDSDGGSTFVMVNTMWYHFPPGGTYPVGTRHPVSATHSKAVPGRVPAGYGRPGSTVRVPAKAGFGGSGKAGGSGG